MAEIFAVPRDIALSRKLVEHPLNDNRQPLTVPAEKKKTGNGELTNIELPRSYK